MITCLAYKISENYHWKLKLHISLDFACILASHRWWHSVIFFHAILRFFVRYIFRDDKVRY